MLDPRIAEAFARLPDYLGSHVLVSLAALALGLAVSLPFAVYAARRPVWRTAILAFSSVVQTVPGLAMLALFYPLLLALAAMSERALGVGFSALGFLPAVLALALYSMLPVMRNTVTGLAGVERSLVEAARSCGMTAWQSLRIVELPLALPVIMAGIRTAAVWVIGTATLSTPIGYTSLGNYIFTGLQTQNWVYVLFGCIAAAALALMVDQLLALMETGLRVRRRLRVAFGGAGLALLVAAALIPAFARPQPAYMIGTKSFAEQYILAALMQQRLGAAGLLAARRDGLGSSIIFDALAAGEIDAYVEYSGTVWANQMRRADVRPRAEVLDAVGAWLRETHGITLVGGLGFENAYALAMRRTQAEALGIRSIADLAPHAGRLSIAGDYEFFGRPEWRAIRDTYGLAFRREISMQAEFMYPAAAASEVDVISAFSSDGRIAHHDLVVLDDPRQAIPPYDAILLVSPKRADDRALIEALRPLVGAVDVTTMREANLRASGGGTEATPDAVAAWLWERIGK